MNRVTDLSDKYKGQGQSGHLLFYCITIISGPINETPLRANKKSKLHLTMIRWPVTVVAWFLYNWDYWATLAKGLCKVVGLKISMNWLKNNSSLDFIIGDKV